MLSFSADDSCSEKGGAFLRGAPSPNLPNEHQPGDHELVAAIYARKSTEQSGVSDDQKSVARQIEQARAFAHGRGWTVDDALIFVDDGISGAEFDRRPAFLRLMNSLKPRAPFQVLVMSEESRLGREAIETAYALKQLVQAGVRVWFYLENRERTLDSPTDKVLLSLTTFADELEREKARQRTYDAMQRKARAGHVTGGRVFGYDNVDVIGPDGQRSHVERRINDREAVIVRQIFELTAAGYGRKRVVDVLNGEGAVAPRAQRGRPGAWCPSSVHEALHRELYRGVIVWNKSKKRDAWGQHRAKARAESEWLRVEADHLRLVPEELWQAVHQRLSRRRDAYMRSTGGRAFGRPLAGTVSPYLLTGFCACGCCDGTMVVRTRPHGRRRDPRLECWYYRTRGRRVCSNRYQPSMQALEAVVLDAIETEVLNPQVVDLAVAKAVAILEAPEDRGEADAVAAELAALDAELARLAEVAATAGDVGAIAAALRARQVRRDALVARQTRAKARSRPQGAGKALAAALRGRFEDWRGMLRRNVQQARPVLEALLAGRVVVTPQCDDEGAEVLAFDVRIPLTTRGIYEGMALPQGMASPTGFEPVF